MTINLKQMWSLHLSQSKDVFHWDNHYLCTLVTNSMSCNIFNLGLITDDMFLSDVAICLNYGGGYRPVSRGSKTAGHQDLHKWDSGISGAGAFHGGRPFECKWEWRFICSCHSCWLLHVSYFLVVSVCIWTLLCCCINLTILCVPGEVPSNSHLCPVWLLQPVYSGHSCRCVELHLSTEGGADGIFHVQGHCGG